MPKIKKIKEIKPKIKLVKEVSKSESSLEEEVESPSFNQENNTIIRFSPSRPEGERITPIQDMQETQTQARGNIPETTNTRTSYTNKEQTPENPYMPRKRTSTAPVMRPLEINRPMDVNNPEFSSVFRRQINMDDSLRIRQGFVNPNEIFQPTQQTDNLERSQYVSQEMQDDKVKIARRRTELF